VSVSVEADRAIYGKASAYSPDRIAGLKIHLAEIVSPGQQGIAAGVPGGSLLGLSQGTVYERSDYHQALRDFSHNLSFRLSTTETNMP
jgi:hypothetical protein